MKALMKALETKSDIAEAMRVFKFAFNAHVAEAVSVAIGYRGGSTRKDVLWMPSLNLWAYFGYPPSEKSSPNRYWNVFGIGRPSGTVSIACEINPPIKARRYPPAGVLAITDRGTIVVLHRGIFTVTGGITLAFVKKHFKGKWTQFTDRGQVRSAIVVAEVNSPEFGSDVRDFVYEVVRVKDIACST